MKIFTLILLFFALPGFSQSPAGKSSTMGAFYQPAKPARITARNLQSKNSFVQNIGQYNDKGPVFQKMGTVQFGFEGLDMPVLFTSKGLIHLQRKTKKEEERGEKMKNELTGEESENELKVTDKIITMEWIDANEQVQIIAEGLQRDYHTYGLLPGKASGYGKITYKDLYPGIDVVYHFTDTDKPGFEYSIIVHPGADPSQISMKYDGDVKKISIDKNGNLLVASAINGITESRPVAFSCSTYDPAGNTDKQSVATTTIKRKDNTIGFEMANYDNSKTLVIDPFVSNTLALSGPSSGIAKDIDFDYEGNVYVAGGGEFGNFLRLAKYDPSGNLVWTFVGMLFAPSWNWGYSCGGWVVDKASGKTFIGQGFQSTGTRVIRIDAAGVYDNYITDPDPGFRENWKMIWRCNNGTPQILVTGGGISTNLTLAICSPPSTMLAGSNMTGLPTFAQDIVDVVIDPVSNDMYSIFASAGLSPILNDMMFLHRAPYGPGNIVWNRYSGFSTVNEAANRPYIISGSSDNSANLFAINSTYLFYWDGLNLMAYNKVTGTNAGTGLTLTPNIKFWQGGIYADECNNVFVGNVNGTIKVYKFNGVNFDDAAAPDISVPGYPTASVYDLAYDDARQLLYASGNGFVAAFDLSSYCSTTAVYTLSVATDCPALSVQASLNPTPPPGTQVLYVLYDGATQIASNNTGFFSGLSPIINYTIKAFINQSCSGIQLMANFNLGTCGFQVGATKTNPSCHGASDGSITASGYNGTPAYQFSIDGVNFQASGLFTGLAAGNYTITGKDAAGLTATTNVTLTDPPLLQVSAIVTDASCSVPAGGSINATGNGGTAPLEYSIDGINFQPTGLFSGLTPGNYTVTVKDVKSCSANTSITIGLPNTIAVNAGNNFSICAGQSGTMTASSNATNFVWAPATGLSDPNILNPVASPIFTTTYTLTASTGPCSKTSAVTVTVNPLPVVNAGTDFSLCIGQSATMPASSTGTSFEWTPATGLSDPFILNPVVTPAATTTYTLKATDGNFCSNTSTIKVTVNTLPVVNAGNDFSICKGQSGILTASTNGTGIVWTPATGLSDPFILNPVASPLVTTVYTLNVVSGSSCHNSASVTVTVKPLPAVNAGSDFTICEGDKKTLPASSDGSSFLWSPVTGLSDPTILNPLASPVVTTVYTLTATDNNLCKNSASIKITVNPAPIPNAGPDAALCFGKSVQLNGSGGVTYQWRPVSFLSAYNIPNPVVTNPGSGSITYFLTVTDANGCSSLQPDAVTVKVSLPAKVFAGNDTIVAINQYLRLLAVDVNHLGFTDYNWSPVYGLNDALAQSPVAQLDRDITYTVQAKTAEGCIGSDDIRVKVYKGPEIYVPNAFTPNNDQLNDIMKAIPVGIVDFHYFRIFNRYGQLVFSTANPANGWNGVYQGAQQGTGTYVWMAEAVDYLGNVLRRKGTFVLLR